MMRRAKSKEQYRVTGDNSHKSLTDKDIKEATNTLLNQRNTK